jgi:hypothetical protein
MEDGAHDFSSFGPFFAFSKNDPIAKDPDSVLNKESFLDIMFIIDKKEFEELRISQYNKDPIKSIGNKSPHIGIGVIGNFSKIVFVTLFPERLFSEVKCANEWDEGKSVDFVETFECTHTHVRLVDVFDCEVDDVAGKG